MKYIFPLLAAICASVAAALFYDMIMTTVVHASDFIKGYFAILCIGTPGVITFLAMAFHDLPEGKSEKQKMFEAYLAGENSGYALDRCNHELKKDFEQWYQSIKK